MVDGTNDGSQDSTRDNAEGRGDNADSQKSPRRGNRGGQGRGGNYRRSGPSKEWKLIEQLAMQSLAEQRKSRRWSIFFKLATLGYLFLLVGVLNPSGWGGEISKPGKSHTALVDLKGVIMDGQESNADSVVSGLRSAFEAEHSKAVILRINSPGGSPVQSGMIYREIVRLKEKNPEKKIYAVITDIGASGGYYVAAAADEIYADPASIVGSIGVISDGFGYTAAMEKLGVERRVFSSGENKAMLDPFSPLNAEQSAHFSTLLDDVHRQFIAAVKSGRGDRLKENATIFSGLMWSGEQALALGLIDAMGSPGYVADKVVGAEEIVDYTVHDNPFKAIADRLGVKVGSSIVESIVGGVQLR